MPDLVTRDTQPNHQIKYIIARTTQTVSRSWLFHSLYPLHLLTYLDCFTVPNLFSLNPLRIYADLGSRGYFGVYRRSCKILHMVWQWYCIDELNSKTIGQMK